jgi:hypothetical protein
VAKQQGFTARACAGQGRFSTRVPPTHYNHIKYTWKIHAATPPKGRASYNRTALHPNSVFHVKQRRLLSDTESAKYLTQQIICGKFASDAAQCLLRQAQLLSK